MLLVRCLSFVFRCTRRAHWSCRVPLEPRGRLWSLGNCNLNGNPLSILGFDQGIGTSLYIAAFNGHLSVVKLLVQLRANLDAVDSQASTALKNNIWMNIQTVVTSFILLVNFIQNALASTALFAAARKDHSPVVQFLLEQNASVKGFLEVILSVT